ncbi:hypothetical protein O181_015465 [Austropuccinia psidii MF-1]|uniref:Reverse transcriptase Ty1/copia-type domain-containing protein n=1 Tax=Austropuccinia psidii MF-1 TaxID=1389203 RepID=A0A9Q3GQZ5_9BASI|nr:hypothetical protein [Austropuccinia psidii MF-1]
MEKLKLKWDKELSSIVGVEIKRNCYYFQLKQSELIRKLLESTGSIFMAQKPLLDVKLESSEVIAMDRQYLAAIGMILYLAQATRLDLIYMVNLLASFDHKLNNGEKDYGGLGGRKLGRQNTWHSRLRQRMVYR